MPEPIEYPYVTYAGFPIPEFPEELVDLSRPTQIIRIPFIRIKNVTYDGGCYVQLDRVAETDEFKLVAVGLQPHLMRAA